MATQRGREITLTLAHICHRTRIPFWQVLIKRRCGIKHCKRGCNKEITERVRIVIRCNSYSKTTTEGVAIERERESTLTVYHSCHRTRIPFGHVRIERWCDSKHCKRQKTKTNKKQNVWEVWSDETRELSYIFKNIATEGVATERRRESACVHLLPSILVTAPVFHLDTSWLNTDAVWNTAMKGERRWGYNKQRKQKPTTKQQQKVPFEKQTITENVWELCDQMKNLSCLV